MRRTGGTPQCRDTACRSPSLKPVRLVGSSARALTSFDVNKLTNRRCFNGRAGGAHA